MSKVPTNEEILELLREKEDRTDLIDIYFKRFKEEIIPDLIAEREEAVSKKKKTNIYSLVGAKYLAGANAVTRTFSTRLGNFLEKIANLSDRTISPEFNLGYKIPEVDLFLLDEDDKIYAVQIKNQKNTLTGSQYDRTIKGLSKFENFWFVASIKTKTGWTFQDKEHRLVGAEFWSKIGIDYEEQLMPLLEDLILSVENAFVSK